MAKLKDKIENALNEARMLVLGGEVLIGSSFRAVFNNGFQELPRPAQLLHVASLLLMLFGLGLLLLPCPYHRIAAAGENSSAFHRLITRVLEVALFPFAVGLGVESYLAATVIRPGIAIPVGAALAAVPMAVWYAYPLAIRKDMKGDANEEPVSLTDKVKESLIEARIILPGAQALLGFQVASVFSSGFDRLSHLSKLMHLGSILAICISAVLLIAPAACHRIAFKGEDSEEFLRISGRLTLSAIIWLGLGICGDLFVVIERTTASVNLALTISALMLVFLYGVWFGYSYWKR